MKNAIFLSIRPFFFRLFFSNYILILWRRDVEASSVALFLAYLPPYCRVLVVPVITGLYATVAPRIRHSLFRAIMLIRHGK
jgi:uncharacterized membrane protein (DUF106 family)